MAPQLHWHLEIPAKEEGINTRGGGGGYSLIRA